MLVKKNNMRRGRGDYQEELRIFVTGREADENGGGGRCEGAEGSGKHHKL